MFTMGPDDILSVVATFNLFTAIGTRIKYQCSHYRFALDEWASQCLVCFKELAFMSTSDSECGSYVE